MPVIEVCERLMDSWLETVSDENGRALTKRSPKYHAQIKDKPGLWACGTSREEAIGALVRNHPEIFETEISYLLGKLPR